MKVNKENFMRKVKEENWSLANLGVMAGFGYNVKCIEEKDFSDDEFDILCWLLDCNVKYLAGDLDAILDEVPNKKNIVFGPNHITKDNFDKDVDIETFSANSRVGKTVFKQALTDDGIYLPVTVTGAIARAADENGLYFDRWNTSLIMSQYSSDDVKLIIEKMDKLTINQLNDVQRYAMHLKKSAIIKRQYTRA